VPLRRRGKRELQGGPLPPLWEDKRKQTRLLGRKKSEGEEKKRVTG
jgi:hypothetical protein